jgi:protein TIF31
LSNADVSFDVFATSQTYVEFTEACEQAAVAIVDGHITPMNPQDNEKSHVYIFNNIFFSKCSDTQDSLKEFKGDDAARKSMNYDLANQKLVQAVSTAHFLLL